MDFIAFRTKDLGPTSLESAEPINGYDSAMWIERYREPGEFQFTAPLASGLRDVLPLDTIISHVDSSDLMFVESHEITETDNEDPIISITGRSFDAFLEQRVVSLHRNWETNPNEVPNYVLPFDYSWNQARDLINKIIYTDTYFRPEEAIPNMIAETDISGSVTPAAPAERVINRGYLSERVRELLAIDDLGLRMVRRNPFGIEPGDPTNSLFLIHNGKDRRESVIFSSKKGEIEAADYLWTNKTLKNAALMTGRWYETEVNAGSTVAEGYLRRETYIEAQDIDQRYETTPSGPIKAEILGHFQTRGQMLLASKRQFMITRADISKRTKYQYRQNYGIGDIVTVQSNYGDVMFMRVVEFTEIEDDEGETGHPTLGVLDY